MEADIAISGGHGKGSWAILASDRNAGRGVFTMKSDADRHLVVSENLVLSVAGDAGDQIQLSDYLQANLKLYSLRNHVSLRSGPSAAWIRQTLANSIRSRTPYQANVLMVGLDRASGDEETSSSVHWLDYLGTSAKVPYAALGYAAYLVTSTLDRYYVRSAFNSRLTRQDPNGTLEDGIALMRRCIDELGKRLIIHYGSFIVRAVTEDGVQVVNLSTAAQSAPSS